MSRRPEAVAALADPDINRRLDALRVLAKALPRAPRRGTNTHVHTNHSFSVFRSPCEAAWHGALAGLEVLGINDFFTVAGIDEFAQACVTLRLPAIFSVECIAVDRALLAAGTLMNDPANPGKVYLCGKGVVAPEDAEAGTVLTAIRAKQEGRNRLLVANLDRHFQAAIAEPGPTWQQVVALTPAGNTTERHVARAAVERLLSGGEAAFAGRFRAVVGIAPAATFAEQQNQARAQLLKNGKPCYVPEDAEAFPDIAGLRRVFLRLGAIPTYPILGNPVTEGERDMARLFDRIDNWGFRAVELIPHRNSGERVAAAVAEAERRGWPVCDGTEHNTPVMEPLTTAWGLDPRFRPRFHAGALVVLGHQRARASGEAGYVDAEGHMVEGGYERCLERGRKE